MDYPSTESGAMSNVVAEGYWVLCVHHLSNVPGDESAYEVNGEPTNLYFATFEEALPALRARIADYKKRGWAPVKALYVDNTVDSNEPYVTAIDDLSDVAHPTMGAPQRGSDLRPAKKMAL